MNRHHPYGGYDERPARGGRGVGGGAAPSMRGGPPPPGPGGMSPPPSGYPSAQDAYGPTAAGGSDASASAYQPQGAYSASNEFAGGPDRHYQMPMSAGPQRGGMAARGAHASAPRPPPPHASPAYGYTPASFDNAPYNAANAYDPSGAPPSSYPGPPPPNQPPYGQPAQGYQQDYNGPPNGPPPPGGFDGPNYGAPPMHGQFRPGPPSGPYGRPRPPMPPAGGNFGFRGGRGGGRGGRGGGFGGGGGRGGFDEDEKPCRTLFVRSIQFEIDSQFVKREFEKFGQIKTFFDMVNKRGIAFVTYYDLRSARDAMLAMKGAPLGGRPINIHYSLPREEDKAQRCDRDKNQGTLFSVLKNAQQDLTDEAIRQAFAEFGDIKKIRDYPGQKNSRFVEYFDSRACQLAHDRLNGQSFLDGQWDLKFAWDLVTEDDFEWAQAGPQDAQPSWRQPAPPAHQPPAQQPGAAGGYPGGAGPGGLGHGRAPVPPTGPPVDNGWGRRAGSGSAPPPAAASAQVPGSPPPAGDANRLEQAQKVQQLLASLGAAAKPAPAASSTPPAPAASSPGAAHSPPPAPSAASGAPALPANIAALLQSAAGAPKPMQPPKPQSPPGAGGSAAGQDNGQQSMQQLLSMLNQNRPPRPS
ncbi:protein Mei2 [Moesziomyces antarcticus T-34]|uniref:Protein Mei2 n=1 Tax=Pseudozyma antarctica (strain T-34) TaxID=1151754 RepID=M9MFY9_PSEA3|nr:protein Mei2 [Moesziomyces antarcticus T-34]